MASLGVIPGAATGWFWAKEVAIERQAQTETKTSTQRTLFRCSNGSLAATLRRQKTSISEEVSSALVTIKNEEESIQKPDPKKEVGGIDRELQDLKGRIEALNRAKTNPSQLRQDAKKKLLNFNDDSPKRWQKLSENWGEFLKNAKSPLTDQDEKSGLAKAEKDLVKQAEEAPKSLSDVQGWMTALEQWRVDTLSLIKDL